MKSRSYEEFVDKFKPEKITDDCYAPPEVYDAVIAWVRDEYGVDDGSDCSSIPARRGLLTRGVSGWLRRRR